MVFQVARNCGADDKKTFRLPENTFWCVVSGSLNAFPDYFMRFKRKALPSTDTELKAIIAPANMGVR